MSIQRFAQARLALLKGRQASLRISWMVIDQGLSALTNLLLSVMVARSTTASAFGAFAVAFLVYGLVIGFSRALVGQPLQISFASATPEEFRKAAGHSLGAAVVVGSIAALITAVISLAVGGQAGTALIALSLWFPALVLQDTCRMAFFAAGTPRRAAAIDSAWAVVVLGGFSAAMAVGLADGAVIPLTLWGLGATVAAVYGIVLLRVGTTVRGCVQWMRQSTQSLSECRVPAHDGYRSGWHPHGRFRRNASRAGAIRASQVLSDRRSLLAPQQWSSLLRR